MLTTAELASMRATAGEALPGTAVIQTRTFAGDNAGGGSATWAASGTVDCRLVSARGDEREIAERISPDADYIFTLPHDASVDSDARIVSGGGTYSVAHVRDRSWELTTRVEVTKQS